MASIKDNNNRSTGNVAPGSIGSNPASPAGGPAAPAASGNFTNLSGYLNANKDAGSRLGSNIGGKISTDVDKSVSGAQTLIGDSTKANETLGGVATQGTDYEKQLTKPADAPAEPLQAKPLTPSYDVSQYQVNNTGLGAAKDIAKNSLTQFRDIASGNAAKAQANAASMAAQNAGVGVENAQKTFQQKTGALNSEQGRFGLLKDYLGNKDYRRGLQSLDQSFLQQDKKNTLGNLNQNLKTTYDPKLRTLGTEQATAAGQIEGLGTAATEASTNLSNRVKAMQDEYTKSLDQRALDVNAGKDARNAYLNDQLVKLKSGQEIDQEFFNEVGLDRADRYATDAPIVQQQKVGVEGETFEGGDVFRRDTPVTLFNTLKNKDSIDNVLNRTVLNTRANSANDVLNQQDIDNRNMLAQLMGQEPIANQQLSQFVGNQTKDSVLPGEINKEREQFLTNLAAGNIGKLDMVNPFSGGTTKDFQSIDAGMGIKLIDQLVKDGKFGNVDDLAQRGINYADQGQWDYLRQNMNPIIQDFQNRNNVGGSVYGSLHDATNMVQNYAFPELVKELAATGYKNQVKVKK